MSAQQRSRDREVLGFLAEHRFGIAPQVSVLLGCSPRVAQDQLRALAHAGFARSAPIFAAKPWTWRITATGLQAIGAALAPPSLDLSHYAHDLGLGWLWLAARSGTFGELAAVHSERSMRSHDARITASGESFGVGLGMLGPRGGEQRHYADLLLDTRAGRRVAVELELSGKSARRLQEIMLSYAGDARIDAVLYLVPTRRLATRIEQAARDAGIARLVHIQPTAAEIDGAPAALPRIARGALAHGALGVRPPTGRTRARAPSLQL